VYSAAVKETMRVISWTGSWQRQQGVTAPIRRVALWCKHYCAVHGNTAASVEAHSSQRTDFRRRGWQCGLPSYGLLLLLAITRTVAIVVQVWTLGQSLAAVVLVSRQT